MIPNYKIVFYITSRKLFHLLCAGTLRDVNDHDSPWFPVLCSSWQGVSVYNLFHSTSIYRSSLRKLLADFICTSCLQWVRCVLNFLNLHSSLSSRELKCLFLILWISVLSLFPKTYSLLIYSLHDIFSIETHFFCPKTWSVMKLSSIRRHMRRVILRSSLVSFLFLQQIL